MRGLRGPGDSALVDAIRKKKEFLPAYAAANPSLEEHWLVLVTGERYEQATDSVITEWTKVRTKFDRVYLGDLWTGDLQRMDGERP